MKSIFFWYFVIIVIILFSCRPIDINNKSIIDDFMYLHDTTGLQRRQDIYLQVGLENYMKLNSDSTYLRIRISSNYSDSTEYFEFSGINSLEAGNQTYVDVMNLGSRKVVYKYLPDSNSSVFLKGISMDELVFDLLNDYNEKNSDQTKGGIEYIIEILKDGKYIRLLSTSFLHFRSSLEKTIIELLTVSELESKILEINRPLIPPTIEPAEIESIP